MASTQANGITIEYETLGAPGDEPMLLVMGFGAQLVYWPPEFLRRLAARGFMLVTYDNRDVGLSTHCAGAPQYTLDDMASDGMGLLDALGIESAHIVGASMGGFIVQRMAIKHPSRVRSLCSVMSTPGDPTLPTPAPEVMAALMQTPVATREDAIEQAVATVRVLASPGFPFDEGWARAATSYDRGYDPDGRMRQAMAVAGATDIRPELANLTVPTVVVHGADDPLVSPLGGESTAKAIPGADLVMIPGMGHDLPEGAFDTVIDAITTNAARAKP